MKLVSTFNIQFILQNFKIVDVNLAQPPFHYVHAPLQIMKRIPIPQSVVASGTPPARAGGFTAATAAPSATGAAAAARRGTRTADTDCGANLHN